MDIGSLTGAIALEDQMSGQLTIISSRVKKFADGFDGAFGAMAISVGVLTAAVAGAVVSITALGEKGSTILGVEDAFNRLAIAAGSTGDALLGGLNEGVKDTVDSMVLMQSVNRALTAGVKLSAADMKVLGETARAMGKATGTDAADGLRTLTSALTTGQTRGLRMAGILVDVEKAERNFAASLGTTRDQLNDAGKLEAKRIAMLDAMREKVKLLGVSELNFKERVQQSAVALGNWTDNLAKAVASSPNVLRAYDAISDAIQKTFGASSQTLLETIVKWVNKFADGVAHYGPIVIRTLGDIKDGVVAVWNSVRAAWDTVPDWFKNIARDAGLAAGGVMLVNGALKATGGADMLTTIGSFATITSGVSDLTKAGLAGIPIITRIGSALQGLSIIEVVTISVKGLGAAIMGVVSSPLALVAATVASIYAAFQVGKTQVVSDFFEEMMLGFRGMSSEAAQAAIAVRRMRDEIDEAFRTRPGAGASGKDTHLSTEVITKPPTAEFLAASSAASKFADAVKSAYDRISGRAATEQIKVLDAAFRKLAASGELTKDQVNAVVKEALALSAAGGRLTPQLWEMVKVTDALSPGLSTMELDLKKIGERIDIVVPKLDAYLVALKAMAELPQTTIVGSLTFGKEENVIDVGKPWLEMIDKLKIEASSFRDVFNSIPDTLKRAFEGGGGIAGALQSIAVAFGQSFGDSMTKTITAQLDKLGKGYTGSAMSGKTIGASAAMGALAAGTAAASGASSGQQLGSVASTAMNVGMMAKMSGATLAASTAFAAYTAGAGLAVVAAIKIYKAMNDGKKVMQDYYKTFAGGADELRQRMLVLGDAGEKMWIQLTQKTGKGDKAAAQKITAEIEAALAAYQNSPEAIAASTYQTTAQLQETADKAKAVYDYMVASGKYGAAAIAAAFEASNTAAAAAMDDGAIAHQKTLDDIKTKYDDMIGTLRSELDSFASSLQAEADAPEYDEIGNRIYGVLEAQQMARKAVLEAEMAALEEKKAAELTAAEQVYADWMEAGKTTDEALRELFQKPYKIPIEWETGGREGFAPVPGSGPSPPPVSNASAPAASSRGGVVNIKFPGSAMAELVVPFIPGVVQDFGIG